MRAFIAARPAWLETRTAFRVQSIPPLDRGEEAAISLALESKADALLIDERDGRRAASQRGIVIVGTLGVLEQAAKVGLLSLPDVVGRLKNSDFRIDLRLVEDALKRDAQHQRE